MSKPSHRATSRHAGEAIALLGHSIRVARIERKLRMDDAAGRAGLSRALLRRIETGDPGASIGAVFEVAAVVGVPLFEVERGRLANRIAHQSEKLALMPAAVRRPRGQIDDDF